MKHHELESENRELKSLTEDVEFLREENSRLRRLLRGKVWQNAIPRTTYYPPRRPPPNYNVPPAEYRQPPPGWRASRDSMLRPRNEYGSRFLIEIQGGQCLTRNIR